MTPVDAVRIVNRLWLGPTPPAPARALVEAGFATLVLCAVEDEPLASSYPGLEVVRVPLAPRGACAPSPYEECVLLARASTVAACRVRSGRAVLVASPAGANRSGVVAALALRELTGWPGWACRMLVQVKRPGALADPHLAAHVDALPGVASRSVTQLFTEVAAAARAA
jgi:hypothetical protein